MFEQLLGLSIVWGELQRLLDFRSRELRFLLLEVDFRQHDTNHRGITRLQGSLQFLHCIIHLALAAVNFRKTMVRCGAAWSGGKHGPKFFLRGVGVPCGELLAAPPKA